MKTVNEALMELWASLDKMSENAINLAKEHALDMLDGRDEKAEMKANKAKAKSEAYHLAAEKVNDLRRLIKEGKIKLQ